MKSNMNKSCMDVFKHICENLDEDLDSPKCRAVKKHIDGCADCLTYLDTLKKTASLYRRYPVPALSRATKDRLRNISRSRA